ncbi:MAG: hypothetical protein HWN66_19015 [Candidatus Helarchaeota archaeon]|nr:hypothetical protein [Candidatus Helarchaeota archaeon]
MPLVAGCTPSSTMTPLVYGEHLTWSSLPSKTKHLRSQIRPLTQLTDTAPSPPFLGSSPIIGMAENTAS